MSVVGPEIMRPLQARMVRVFHCDVQDSFVGPAVSDLGELDVVE